MIHPAKQVVGITDDLMDWHTFDMSNKTHTTTVMLEARVMIRFDAVRHYAESIGSLLADLRSEVLERRHGHFLKEARLIAAVLEQGTSRGDFWIEESSEMARTLLAATNDLLPYSLSASELGRRGKVQRRVRSIVDLLILGLTSIPPRARP